MMGVFCLDNFKNPMILPSTMQRAKVKLYKAQLGAKLVLSGILLLIRLYLLPFFLRFRNVLPKSIP